MKIPKYIEKALEQRVKAAEKFNETDNLISRWLEEKGIEVEIYDTHGGVDSIVNPDASADRIREAILEYEEEGQ